MLEPLASDELVPRLRGAESATYLFCRTTDAVGRVRVGVIGAHRQRGAAAMLGHEAVRQIAPGPSANAAGPVLAFHRGSPVLDALVDRSRAWSSIVDVTDAEGVRHECLVPPDGATTARLREAFASLERLYIADGHHRVAAARAQGRPILTVCLAAAQLELHGYHRVVQADGVDAAAIRQDLEASLGLVPSPQPVVPTRSGDIGVFLEGGWYRGVLPAPTEAADASPLRDVDTWRFEQHLRARARTLRAAREIAHFPGAAGARAAEELARATPHALAFTLAPCTAEQVMAVADAGLTMPAKSTWFAPKPAADVLGWATILAEPSREP